MLGSGVREAAAFASFRKRVDADRDGSVGPEMRSGLGVSSHGPGMREPSGEFCTRPALVRVAFSQVVRKPTCKRNRARLLKLSFILCLSSCAVYTALIIKEDHERFEFKTSDAIGDATRRSVPYAWQARLEQPSDPKPLGAP